MRKVQRLRELAGKMREELEVVSGHITYALGHWDKESGFKDTFANGKFQSAFEDWIEILRKEEYKEIGLDTTAEEIVGYYKNAVELDIINGDNCIKRVVCRGLWAEMKNVMDILGEIIEDGDE